MTTPNRMTVGDDRFAARAGNDTVHGGDGVDTFVFGSNYRFDEYRTTTTDFEGGVNARALSALIRRGGFRPLAAGEVVARNA